MSPLPTYLHPRPPPHHCPSHFSSSYCIFLFLLLLLTQCLAQIFFPPVFSSQIFSISSFHFLRLCHRRFLSFNCLPRFFSSSGIVYCTANNIRFMYSQKIKLRGLVPNFHVSLSDLYIPTIDPPIFLHRSQIHECRNLERGHAVSFQNLFVSNFRYSVFALPSPPQRLSSLLLLFLEVFPSPLLFLA
jgi:hypothetical protein